MRIFPHSIKFMIIMVVIFSSIALACGDPVEVSIEDYNCNVGDAVITSIILSDIQNYGTGTINITYNPDVVHVTDVSGSTDSTVTAQNPNNNAGIVLISAWNMNGESGDILFANVSFTAVGTGSTTLELDVPTLKDTDYNNLQVTLSHGSINIISPQPEKPFVICGYVNYEDGSPCSNPAVEITNKNSDEKWQAQTIEDCNYYSLIINTPVDLESGDVLQFDVTCGSDSGVSEYTVTADDISAGGVFNHNLTLLAPVDPAPYIVSCTISNTIISPNGDGVQDDTSIDTEFSEPVDAAILIEDATGVVKTLYTGSAITDPDSQTWDGTNDDGNTVALGTYQVNITMDDGVNPLVSDNTRSVTVADQSIAIISIGNGSGIVTIPITIENGVNVGSCDITLHFDPSVVNVTGVSDGAFDATAVNLEHIEDDGFVRIGAYQTNNPGLNGYITAANITFEPVSSSGSCSLELSVTTFKDATIETNPMPYTICNGTYTSMLNGDVNGDGTVDIADAMYLAKAVLEITGYEADPAVSDVNGDGEVTLYDASYLAKHVIGVSGFEELL